MTSPIRLAFSPDSDDAFMFLGLLRGAVDAEGLTFVAEQHDTETLNAMAESGEVDVLAVSVARYAAIADRYLLLPHGASVGRGYGPVVVALSPLTPSELAGKRVAVPGLRTTAYLVLRLLAPAFEPVVVPITPHEAVFDALRARKVDAALLIHEGRLTYPREGCQLVMDIGIGWQSLTKLPLPLGVNVIRRALGSDLVAKISRACRRSITWAFDHRDVAMDALLEQGGVLDRDGLDRYLAMYANADTQTMQPDVLEGMGELFRRAREAGLISAAVRIEVAP